MATISVISKKGGSGKTPISFNLAKATGSAILTNDDDVLEELHGSCAKTLDTSKIDRLDFGKINNLIIDFGGYVDKNIPSIIRKSDLVIVPLSNHISSLKRNIEALNELVTYNENIIVVVTMTKKKTDFDEVKEVLKSFNIKAFFELKYTSIFNNSLDKGISIEEYINSSNLIKSAYSKRKNQKSESILEQWDELVTYVKNEIKNAVQ